MKNKLFFYSAFSAFSTLILLVAGGLVTSTGSGLSVPDWPLSYGSFFPPMIGGIRFEHSHRLIAGFVGFCTLGLTVWLLKTEKRRPMRVLAVVASLAILAQAILGGITVKYLLPTPVSVLHACLGQTFFSLLCVITLLLSEEWKNAAVEPNESASAFFRLSCTTTAFVYAQLVAGAVVRHAHGKGILVHFFTAFFIVVHIVFVNYKMLRDKALTRSFCKQVLLMDGLLVCQLFLGLGSYFFKFLMEQSPQPRVGEVLFTTAHQTTGAMILANLFVMSFRAKRLFSQKTGAGSSTEFLELMKPRILFAALATTLAGYWLAPHPPMEAARILNLLLGAALVGGGGNALNQYFERDTDKQMPRTAGRPIPSGRLEPSHALWFGLLVGATGLLELLIFVSAPAALVGLSIFLGYVFVYTPLKRVTPLNTFVGAVPGALPLILGWAAAKGPISADSVSLFLIVFLWQIPHFYAIAWAYKEDYLRGGLRMMPGSDREGKETGAQIVLFTLLLFAATLLPYRIGLCGNLYLSIALLTGLLFLGYSVLLRNKKLVGARKFASASIVYLFVLIAFLVADKT